MVSMSQTDVPFHGDDVTRVHVHRLSFHITRALVSSDVMSMKTSETC